MLGGVENHKGWPENWPKNTLKLLDLLLPWGSENGVCGLSCDCLTNPQLS